MKHKERIGGENIQRREYLQSGPVLAEFVPFRDLDIEWA